MESHLCSQIGRLKMSIHKASYRFNAISIKIHNAVFCRNKKIHHLKIKEKVLIVVSYFFLWRTANLHKLNKCFSYFNIYMYVICIYVLSYTCVTLCYIHMCYVYVVCVAYMLCTHTGSDSVGLGWSPESFLSYSQAMPRMHWHHLGTH